jgi:hypothetical protein
VPQLFLAKTARFFKVDDGGGKLASGVAPSWRRIAIAETEGLMTAQRGFKKKSPRFVPHIFRKWRIAGQARSELFFLSFRIPSWLASPVLTIPQRM